MMLCDVYLMLLAANSWTKSNLGNHIGAMHAKTPSQVPNLSEKLITGEAFPKEEARLCWNDFKEKWKNIETVTILIFIVMQTKRYPFLDNTVNTRNFVNIFDGKEKRRENCMWTNKLFNWDWLFFQERSKGCSTESLSVLFTWQVKRKIFLVLACVLLTKKMKCAKHNEVQIFQRQFSMIFWCWPQIN